MLSRGDTGDEVRTLQAFLNAEGCRDDGGLTLAVDGAFGERTVQALKVFQARAGLAADGVFGQQTEVAARALGFDGGALVRIEGVDVSYFQTDGHGKSLIDWPSLVPEPAFFWARSSLGLSADATYAPHIAAGSATGAVPGAYHFFIATDDPKAQAKLWRATAGEQPANATLRPAIDIENNRVDANKQPVPLTDAEAKLWATNARMLILSGEDLFARKLVVYINPKTAIEMKAHLDEAFWGARLLWLAEYTNGTPSIPFPWKSCGAHQFAGNVAMPGATCLMDRNVIYRQSAFDQLKS